MLAKTTTPDPANPRGLGVTRCTACGQSVEVVGPLRQDEHCGVCGHELDRYNVLTDELRRIVAPWVAACHARQIGDQVINEVWELVGYDLDQPEGSVLA